MAIRKILFGRGLSFRAFVDLGISLIMPVSELIGEDKRSMNFSTALGHNTIVDCLGTQHSRMNSQYRALFNAIDEYVRTRHHCFVAECFLNPRSQSEWFICIRPTKDNVHSVDEQACKYFRLSLTEAEEVCTAHGLSDPLMGRIDGDLHSITER